MRLPPHLVAPLACKQSKDHSPGEVPEILTASVFVLWKRDCTLWFAASILEESLQVRARFERFEPGWLQRAGKSDLAGSTRAGTQPRDGAISGLRSVFKRERRPSRRSLFVNSGIC
jgi:hypothetical protein